MDLSTVRDFKFFVCLPRQQRDTMNFQAFNLTDNSELIGLVDEFRHGTAYTSFDRSTFSYRYESEGRIITKQKPKCSKKISPKTKRIAPKKRTRVRWSEVRKRCTAFFNLKRSKKYTTFITLSFPSGLSDKNCRKCLNTWLTRIRTIRPYFPYLWVAERQKNGTLHYHLLTNIYLPIRIINRFMAIAIDGLKADQVGVFKKWNRNNYNGVDVKAVRNSKALKGYLAKYITKNDDKIDGAPWHCSRLFSNLATTMCFHPADILAFVNGLSQHKDFLYESIRVIVSEFSITILLPNQIPKLWINSMLMLNDQIDQMLKDGKEIPSAVKVVDMERRSDYITEKTSATLSGQQRLVHSYQWESY